MTSQFVAGCLFVTATLAALIGLGKAGIWVWDKLRKAGRLADDLTGEPARPGFPASPGVLERMAGIEAALAPVLTRLDSMENRLAAVEAQMHPNGGSTLRDAVDRLQPAETPPQ